MGALLTFDEAKHEYRLDGRVVPSVTQVLGAVYRDVYAGIPAEVLARKAALGQAVHRVIQLFLLERLDTSTVHASVEPYFESWLQWWATTEYQVFQAEHQFYNQAGGYAGTIDFRSLDNTPAVVDWKITSTRVPTHPIQIGGYAYHTGATEGGCLYLKDDGSPGEYVPTNLLRAKADWLATLRVYNLMKELR